jgi:hypothetical protein
MGFEWKGLKMDGWVYERKDEMKWGECLGVLGIHDTRSYLSPYDLHGCLPFFFLLLRFLRIWGPVTIDKSR